MCRYSHEQVEFVPAWEVTSTVSVQFVLCMDGGDHIISALRTARLKSKMSVYRSRDGKYIDDVTGSYIRRERPVRSLYGWR